MALALGGTVERTGLAEFGRTPLSVVDDTSTLFAGLPDALSVWMSHGDSVSAAPDGFTVTARSAGAAVAGFEQTASKMAGVQFHPEVLHTEHGQAVLEHFLYDIAGIEPTWTTANVIDEQVAAIRAAVGDKRGPLRALRRRRLRRGRGPRPASRGRSPHLRVRRPRPPAGR